MNGEEITRVVVEGFAAQRDLIELRADESRQRDEKIAEEVLWIRSDARVDRRRIESLEEDRKTRKERRQHWGRWAAQIAAGFGIATAGVALAACLKGCM